MNSFLSDAGMFRLPVDCEKYKKIDFSIYSFTVSTGSNHSEETEKRTKKYTLPSFSSCFATILEFKSGHKPITHLASP